MDTYFFHNNLTPMDGMSGSNADSSQRLEEEAKRIKQQCLPVKPNDMRGSGGTLSDEYADRILMENVKIITTWVY